MQKKQQRLDIGCYRGSGHKTKGPSSGLDPCHIPLKWLIASAWSILPVPTIQNIIVMVESVTECLLWARPVLSTLRAVS